MNIRIITFYRKEGNIGQILQLYSLQKVIYKLFNEKALAYDISDIENRFDFVDDDLYKSIYVKKIKSLNDLYEDNVDYYIMGSDQIFNPCFNYNYREFYLLNKIPQYKKIPYAASFYKNCCHNIETKTISFRENISAEYLKYINYKSINNTINQHIDPVFLLNKNDLTKIENYYKSNILISNDYNNNIYYNQTKNKKQISGYIWELNHLDGYCYIQSYHMFVLAIIFNKKIKFVDNINHKDNRFISLIKFLNIKIENNRIVNYDDVQNKIMEEKNKSFEYLKENLI